MDMSSRGFSALASQTRTMRSPLGNGSGRSVTVQARLSAVALAATPMATQTIVRSVERELRTRLRTAAAMDSVTGDGVGDGPGTESGRSRDGVGWWATGIEQSLAALDPA